MTITDKTATGKQARPSNGYAAVYAELTYEVNGKSYALTTQIHILPSEGAAGK